MARHIDAAETAKLIRKVLKDKFPNTKFSVRIKRYSGGSSVNINYSNGASLDAVNEVLSQFKGKTFDGMTDMASYHNSLWEGEEVCFGQYIHCDRNVSKDFIQRVYDYCLVRFGKEAKNLKIGGSDNCAVFDVDDYHENEWLLRKANQILRQSDYDRVFDWEKEKIEKQQQEDYENKLVIAQQEADNRYLDGLDTPQEYQQYVGFENEEFKVVNVVPRFWRSDYFITDNGVKMGSYPNYISIPEPEKREIVWEFYVVFIAKDNGVYWSMETLLREIDPIKPLSTSVNSSTVVNLFNYKETKAEEKTNTLDKLYKTWLLEMIGGDRILEIISYDDWRKTHGQAQLEKQYAVFVKECLDSDQALAIISFDDWIVKHF